MRKKAKSKSPKIGNSKSKTKNIKLNESTDHTDAAADQKEETAIAGNGSISTNESVDSPQSTKPMDENDESESPSDHGVPASDAAENPAPDSAEPSEQATVLEVVDPGGSKPKKKKGKKSVAEAVPAEQNKLSDQERTTLKECLEVIREGMDRFVQVGSAIATIIMWKLYRETHHTFNRYANEVLGLTPRRAFN